MLFSNVSLHHLQLYKAILHYDTTHIGYDLMMINYYNREIDTCYYQGASVCLYCMWENFGGLLKYVLIRDETVHNTTRSSLCINTSSMYIYSVDYTYKSYADNPVFQF